MGTSYKVRHKLNPDPDRSGVSRRRWGSHIVAAGLVSFVVASCASGGPDLQGVAESFNPLEKWELIREADVTEPLCFGSGCKTVVRSWGSDTPPTADDFRTLVQRAGWSDTEIDECRVRQNVTGPVPFCRVLARSGDMYIELTASGPLVGQSHSFLTTLRVSSR